MPKKPHVEELARDLADRYGVKGAKALVEDERNRRSKKAKQALVAEPPSPASTEAMREQYREALYRADKLSRKAKRLKKEVGHAEDALLRAKHNQGLDGPNLIGAAQDLADDLDKHAKAKAEAERAKDNAKAILGRLEAFEG